MDTIRRIDELERENARLKAELAALRAQGAGGNSPVGEGEAADERPPHY